MSAPGMRWYAPVPSDPTTTRALIDFGLRSADLFFRDLVVPGVGRVWFVRQLSWSVAAISLAATLRAVGRRDLRASTLANAMEALGCKLAWTRDASTRGRILGSRAFGRERDGVAWGFDALRRPAAYVRQTHRQNASRALRQEGGLGLADGPRFDRLSLSPAGEELATALLDPSVGRGGGTLRAWLRGWIDGEKTPGPSQESVRAALSPFTPNERERRLVRGRLLEVDGPAAETRRALEQALRGATETPSIERVVVPRLRRAGRTAQAEALVAALSFGAMLDAARSLAAVLTQLVEAQGGSRLALDRLLREARVIEALQRAQDAARRFVEQRAVAGVTERESARFAEKLLARGRREALTEVIGRLVPVLDLADGGVTRGTSFRVLDDARDDNDARDDAEEPDRTGRTFRIANFVSLLRDLEAK